MSNFTSLPEAAKPAWGKQLYTLHVFTLIEMVVSSCLLTPVPTSHLDGVPPCHLSSTLVASERLDAVDG